MKKQVWKNKIAKILLISVLASNVSYAGTWQKENEHWVYQNEGIRATGWMKEAEHDWYHFDQDGRMQTGWIQDEQKGRYYLNKAGEGTEGLMRSGWFLENGTWYFLNTVHDGNYGRAITQQWQWIDGYCYLFDANGAMYADCITPDGYTVNKDGQWMVDGVVQYQKGKGILTKTDSNKKNDSDRNSSSGGGSRPSGDNKPSVDDKPSDEDKPSGDDKPSDEDKPSGDDKPSDEDKPSGDDKPSDDDKPSGDAGKLTIRYIENESKKTIMEQEVIGTPGEIYAIQHPSIEGYKILENQPTEIRFSDRAEEVSVIYRPQKADESPDQSIVASDRVKAIIPDTQESVEFVHSIRSNIFSYEFMDDPELVELSVTNDNPLLRYIEDGTYKEGDIIYIESCDDFPMGLSIIYQGHDDNYSGEFAELYDPLMYEVIHGRKAGILELIQPGTYLDDRCALDTSDFEMAYSWIPSLEPVESVQKKKITSGKARSAPELTCEETINLNGDASKTISMELPLVDKPNFSVTVIPSFETAVNVLPDIDWRDKNRDGEYHFKLTSDSQNTFGLSINVSGDGNLNDIIKEEMEKILTVPENKTQLNFLGGWGEIGELSGVDFEGIYVLGILGLRVNPVSAEKWTTNVNDVFKEKADITDLSPIIPVMLIAELSATGEIEAELKGEISWYNKIGVKAAYSKKEGITQNVIHEYGKSKNELGKQPFPTGNLNITAKLDDAKIGEGGMIGVSVAGIVPVMAKAVVGASLSIEDTHIEGSFDCSKPKEEWFEGETSWGNIILSAYVDINAAATLTGQISLPILDDPWEISINKKFSLLEKEFPLYLFQGADPIPTTLKLNNETSLKAVDAQGKDISETFDCYDSQSKTVKPKSDGKGGYSFQCPRYYRDMNTNAVYEITGIVTEHDTVNKLNLDLKRVTGLKTLVLASTVDSTLDLSQNKELELLCNAAFSYDFDGDEEFCPIPDDYRKSIYTRGAIDGKNLDLSNCKKLHTLHIKVNNTDKIDLSQNGELQHLGIDNQDDTKTTELVFATDLGHIESLYLRNTTLNALPLSRFTNLQYAELLGKSESSLNFSKCKKLRSLSLTVFSPGVDLSGVSSLGYLNMLHTEIKRLNIKDCSMLRKIWGNPNYYIFTGNGKIFPYIESIYGITWHKDPDCAGEQVTKCGNGETIYRYGYNSSTHSLPRIVQKATSSNVRKATASNVVSVSSKDQPRNNTILGRKMFRTDEVTGCTETTRDMDRWGIYPKDEGGQNRTVAMIDMLPCAYLENRSWRWTFSDMCQIYS